MTSKPVSPGPRRLLRRGQQRHAGVERRTGGQRSHRRRRPRVQGQRRRGDDRQRALAADQQVAQVVAGVVLAQAGQAVPDVPAGRHRFEPQAQRRVHCRSAAPGCRRRWWPGCRRSCNCPRRPGSAGTAGRRRRRPAARSAARNRPRPSASGWCGRSRERGSCATGSAAPACRWHRARRHRRGRCCRPAARSACRAPRRRARPRRPHRSSPAAPRRVPCRASACASRVPRPTGRRSVSTCAAPT